MNISFTDIDQHITPMSEFKMNWRFTDERFDQLPDRDLDQLKALNENAAKLIWDYYTTDIDLYRGFPFKKDFFRTIDQLELTYNRDREVQKWLQKKDIAPFHQVILSWELDLAMMVPWVLFYKIF